MATVQPPAFTGAFAYEHTDIPPGVTIDEYRRARAPPSARRDGTSEQPADAVSPAC